jgi:integrase
LTGRAGWCSPPRAARGAGGGLAANNFRRVWVRALKQSWLKDGWPEDGGLHFHDLRHTHATWLLAKRVPMIAVSSRLGHAHPVITMIVYAHVDRQVDRGLLTREDAAHQGRRRRGADQAEAASPCFGPRATGSA